MGLFDKFFKKEQIQTKEAPKLFLNQIDAYAQKTSKDYKAYSKDGYQENAIVHKCISLIATNASAVKLNVFSRDTLLESHELISLLERPNPLQSGVEYFHSLISYLLISGNTYLLKDTEGMRPPKEMYLLRPDRIDIKSGSSYLPHSYRYIMNGQVLNTYDVDQTTGYSDIKHIKLWHPLDDFYGLSPIMASAYNIDQHNLAGLSNLALLKNGCMPSGMLKFMPKDETGQTATLTDEQRARILEDLEFRFKGANNSGRVMLAEGDFDYKAMGLSPKDMNFLELLNMSAREIALVFGVPAQLVGIADQTYANVAEARLALYEECIIPLLMRVQSDLNEWLAPLYSGDLEIRYDIDSIPAMAEKRRQVYENVNSAVNSGILTRNEARERLGLEPISGGDTLLVPSNLFPLGEALESDEEQTSEDIEDNNKDYELAYGEETKAEVSVDTYTTEEEARERATEIGCVGIHSHSYIDGQTVYMPCESHEDYEEALRTKALADLNLRPTDAMAKEAQRGLDWRKEHKRGGTTVGVARANQLVNKENLSPDTVLRMFSFFSRHEVDKQGEGFSPGEKGYPSAGRIAWSLWGGDSGYSWSRTKRNQIMRERDEKSYHYDDEEDEETKKMTAKVKKGLSEKVKKHNEKHGDKKGKKVTLGMLSAVFRRGVGAYRTNPQSVRPSVRASGGEDRWAYARVNAFLSAVRTGRFPSKKFDTDLLPKGHPLSTRK